MYEVEVKYQVIDPDALQKTLNELKIVFEQEYEESDQFYQHPARDFVRTDECLRLRLRSMADGTKERFLTYKGPKIDSETKTRRELEIPLLPQGDWNEMLVLLGFQPAGRVQKFRQRAALSWQDYSFEILLDRLPELCCPEKGPVETGLFIELETIADENRLDDAKRTLMKLADKLGLSNPIRTSYLGLLAARELK